MEIKPLLCSALALASMSAAEAAKKQPNIVFILADDMGYGDVSYYDPNQKINTKNLDNFAKESVVFRDAHTSSSVSTPTRYGILTGRYNWRSSLKSGVLLGYQTALIAPDRSTIATMLKKAGYQTAFIGKWHLGWDWEVKDSSAPAGYVVANNSDNVDYSKPVKNGPDTRGFDYYYGIVASLDHPPYVYVENSMPTDKNPSMPPPNMKRGRLGATAKDMKDRSQTLINFTNRGAQYIKDNANAKKPFFLYLPLTAPHTPIVPTSDYKGKSGLNTYGDFVLMVDDMVGRVFQAIDDAGIRENTIVVFTTDNGCSPAAKIDQLKEMGHSPNSIYRGNKADLFEGGHRVPCMVRYPAEFKHHEVEQTVCLNDFYATFADIAGYKLQDTEAEDSYSLLPALKSVKEVETIREATVHHSIIGQFTIRKGDWKFLRSASSGGWSAPKPTNRQALASLPKVQLYNLKDDPSETTNVQDKYPEIVKELSDLLDKYIAEGRSTPGAPQKNDEQIKW